MLVHTSAHLEANIFTNTPCSKGKLYSVGNEVVSDYTNCCCCYFNCYYSYTSFSFVYTRIL